MFGLAFSICPLASSGYKFANRPKYAPYFPCCGFPGVENSPEASIVLTFDEENSPSQACLFGGCKENWMFSNN
jgi:hypothetical protein